AVPAAQARRRRGKTKRKCTIAGERALSASSAGRPRICRWIRGLRPTIAWRPPATWPSVRARAPRALALTRDAGALCRPARHVASVRLVGICAVPSVLGVCGIVGVLGVDPFIRQLGDFDLDRRVLAVLGVVLIDEQLHLLFVQPPHGEHGAPLRTTEA